MITPEKPNNVVSAGIQNTVSFGIKQEGLAHIFSVLRNQLYSDKILAVIREYSTNAVDAHVEAGKAKTPIKVTLPSRFNSVFKVRDFGFGLSEKDVQDIYAFYGESTKRKSNELIGQLGLGSKSGFAYGDNFVITSFVDGIKTTYNAFIDPSQIGQIAKLASEATDESNGVEISLAVKDHDIQAFHDKAYDLFRYFKVKPEVSGATFDYETKTPIIEGKNWRVFGGSSVAVMGNIGYPLDNHWESMPEISNAINAGIEIDFNIGDLEISASREKLQFSDRTKRVVKDKLSLITKEIVTHLNDKFANCATLFDATKLYGQIMDYGSTYYSLRNLVTKNLTFKGKPINHSRIYFNNPTDGSWNVRHYSKSYRGSRVSSYISQYIDCDENTIIIDNDLMIHNSITNRVYNLCANGKRVYVVSYKDTTQKTAFLKESGLEACNLSLLSSYPKIVLSSGGTGSPCVKNSKHSSKEFVLDRVFAKGANSWHTKKSDFWKQESIDAANDAGLYVILDNFNCQDKNGYWLSPFSLAKVITQLEKLGIKIGNVYGFKSKHQDSIKNNPKMVCVWKHISNELENYFIKNNISQKVADRLSYDAFDTSWLSFIEKNGKDAKKKTLMYQTTEKVLQMKHQGDEKLLDECVEWKEYIKPTTPTYNLKDIKNAFEKQYPLITHISHWEFEKTEAVKAAISYANLIDG